MAEKKIVYQEKCIVIAHSREGKRYTREISLTAQELWRRNIDGTEMIFIESRLKNGSKEEKEEIFASDLKHLRDYFLRKLCAVIDLVHPERRIEVIFPQENKYLKMRRAYCQNCGKFIKEFYGFYEGRITDRLSPGFSPWAGQGCEL